jgi:hypothetical protein
VTLEALSARSTSRIRCYCHPELRLGPRAARSTSTNRPPTASHV